MFQLFNDDCLNILPKLPDKSIDLILVDPPYGTSRTKQFKDKILSFEKIWEQIKRIRKDFIPIIIFGKEPFSSMIRCSNLSEFKYDWIWKKDTKSNFPQAPYQPLNNIEIISIFSNGYARYGNKKMPYNPQMIHGKKYYIPKETTTTGIFKDNHKNGIYKHKERDTSLRYPYNIIEFNTDKNRLHPTQKPVKLLEYLIKTYSNENEVVLDFCMGSGSTGIACINTNRNFIGIELDKKYFDIAKERIENASTSN